jgi:transcriptional regulator with XRE-family HTH domain
MTDFGGEVRRLMAERGMTLGELARRSNYDKGYLSKVMNGRKPASEALASHLDRLLGADGALRTLVSRRKVLAGAATIAGTSLLGALEADERERFSWTQRKPASIDHVTVDSLASALTAQRHLEDSVGSAAMLGPVTAQIAVIEALVSEARGPVRRALVSVAQEWCQFGAWLNISVRNFPASQALWRHTLELAVEIDDATMIATVKRSRGYMAWLAGKPGPMIGLAESVQSDSRAALSQRTLAAALEARGYAMTGDAHASERKLDEAANMAAQLADRPSEQRPWTYWCTPRWIEGTRGITLGYLAHIDRYRHQAIEALTAGYTGLSEDMRRSEWASDLVLHRAAVHLRGGDIEQACADAFQVVPVARQMDSANLRVLLAQLHAAMAARWPDDRRVAELGEAVR